MDRRQFLGLLGSAAATACSRSGAPLTQGGPGDADPAASGPDPLDLEARVPRSLTRTSDAELDVVLNVLDGELPPDWTGHALWMHAVPRGTAPAFVGEGKVVRLDCGPQPSLRSRLVRTPDHYADVATLGTNDGFTTVGFARSSRKLGFRNFPNTALVALGERLLVTSDAGRPWELDPVSLEPVTAVGWNDEWRSVLPGWLENLAGWPFPQHLSTAHAAVDPDEGALYTVNYGIDLVGSANFTDLVRWDGEGALERWSLVDHATGARVEIAQSMHQLALTRDHVILMDTAFLVEISLSGEAPPEAQQPDATLWIVRRSDLGASATVAALRVSLPREAVHFHADFDDADGIVLHVAHNPGADPSEMLAPGDLDPDGQPVPADLAGLPAAPTDLGAWSRVVLDPATGAILDHRLTYDERFWGGPALSAHVGPTLPDRYRSLYWVSAGFSSELRLGRVEALYADHPYREVALADLPLEGRPATLVRIDCDSGEVADAYAFPTGRAGLSPVFVPRTDAADELDGYIVCAVISDEPATERSTGDQLWVFDAADLAGGPICRLGHAELDLPFTLHTLWLPSLTPRTASYRVDVRADHEEAVAGLPAHLQAMFEAEVYPRF